MLLADLPSDDSAADEDGSVELDGSDPWEDADAEEQFEQDFNVAPIEDKVDDAGLASAIPDDFNADEDEDGGALAAAAEPGKDSRSSRRRSRGATSEPDERLSPGALISPPDWHDRRQRWRR